MLSSPHQPGEIAEGLHLNEYQAIELLSSDILRVLHLANKRGYHYSPMTALGNPPRGCGPWWRAEALAERQISDTVRPQNADFEQLQKLVNRKRNQSWMQSTRCTVSRWKRKHCRDAMPEEVLQPRRCLRHSFRLHLYASISLHPISRKNITVTYVAERCLAQLVHSFILIGIEAVLNSLGDVYGDAGPSRLHGVVHSISQFSPRNMHFLPSPCV